MELVGGPCLNAFTVTYCNMGLKVQGCFFSARLSRPFTEREMFFTIWSAVKEIGHALVDRQSR